MAIRRDKNGRFASTGGGSSRKRSTSAKGRSGSVFVRSGSTKLPKGKVLLSRSPTGDMLFGTPAQARIMRQLGR